MPGDGGERAGLLPLEEAVRWAGGQRASADEATRFLECLLETHGGDECALVRDQCFPRQLSLPAGCDPERDCEDCNNQRTKGSDTTTMSVKKLSGRNAHDKQLSDH